MSEAITVTPLPPLPKATPSSAPAARAATPAAGERDPRVWAAAQEFESFFVSQMLDLAGTDIDPAGPFGGGNEERIYRSMMNSEYAKAIPRAGGLGIADAVYREILALQEGGRT